MSDFEARIKYLMSDRIEKQASAHYRISEEEVRESIKDMSFAEYMQLLEASADFGNQSSDMGASVDSSTTDTQGNPNTGSDEEDDPFNIDGTLNTSRDRRGASGQMDLDGAMHDVTVGQRFGNEVEVSTADGNKMRVSAANVRRPVSKSGNALNTVQNAASAAASAKNKFVSGFTKGLNSSAEYDELNSLQELAGLPKKDREKDKKSDSKKYQPKTSVGKAMNTFVRGFNKGKQLTSSAEHDELNRLRELAGIEETCSAGATGAGSIAAAPSIIGDTAHTPTDTLRARLRKKKEKKKD